MHYCYPPIQPGPHEYPCPFATPMNICHCWAPTSRMPRTGSPCWAELICCGESGNGGTPATRLPAHSLSSLTTVLCCDANSSGKRPEETYALHNGKISIGQLQLFYVSLHTKYFTHVEMNTELAHLLQFWYP